MDYKKHYDSLISKAQSQNRSKLKRTHPEYVYYERHHIIPRFLNSSDDKSNLVLLTAREHFMAHKLLSKIHPNNRGAWFSLKMFTTKNKVVLCNISSREVGKIRENARLAAVGKSTKLKGRKLTDEHKKKIGVGVKESDWKLSEDGRSSISRTHKNKIVSDETRKKLSKNAKEQMLNGHAEYMATLNRGRKHSDEVKQKWSEQRKGKKKSKTHCENISKGLKGKHKSEEHLEKIKKSINDPILKQKSSERMKKRWENNEFIISDDIKKKMSESKKGIYGPRTHITIDGIKKMGYEWKKDFNCKNQFDLIDTYLKNNYTKLDERNYVSRAGDNTYKFEESLLLPKRYQIESDEGFSDILMSHKTIPYAIWYVKTESFEIKVADKHKFVGENNKELFADELKINDLLMTKNGLEKVTEVYFTGEYDNTFSPTVNNLDSTYYANGIKNVNTTITAVFLVWFLLFNKEKTIAVLANKMQGAIEIVDRAKVIIEGLPDFLKPGVKNYNKKRIELENGCKLIAAATTPSSVRGLSINCTDAENKVHIKDSITGEEELITMGQLYNRLLLESSDIDLTEFRQ